VRDNLDELNVNEDVWAAQPGQEHDKRQDPEAPMLQAPWPVLQLAFGAFAHVLERSIHKASPFVWSTLHLYLIVVLTFLAIVAREPETRERSSASAVSRAGHAPGHGTACDTGLGADARGGYARPRASSLAKGLVMHGMGWACQRLNEKGL
jgi:hypothetical protein